MNLSLYLRNLFPYLFVVLSSCSYAQVFTNPTVFGDSINRVVGVIQDDQGNFILRGIGQGPIVFGNDTLVSPFSAAYVVKLSPSLEYEWGHIITDTMPSDNYIHDMTTDPAGNVYVSGIYDQKMDLGDTTLDAGKNNNGYLIKYSASGSVVWAKHYLSVELTGAGTGIPCIKADDQGNLYAAVGWNQTLLFYGDSLVASSGTGSSLNGPANFMIIKFDSMGDTVWTNRIFGRVNDFWNSGRLYHGGFEFDPDGNIYLAFSASLRTEVDTFVVNYLGNHIVLIKFDPQGNAKWVRHGGPPNQSTGFRSTDIAIDPFGNIFLTGEGPGTAIFGSEELLTSTEKILIAQYDTAGQESWLYGISTNGSWSRNPRIKTDSNHNFYLVGDYRTFIEVGTSFSLSQSTLSGPHPYFIKCNYTSGHQWEWIVSTYGQGNYGCDLVVVNEEEMYAFSSFIEEVDIGDTTLFTEGRGFFAAQIRNCSDLNASFNLEGIDTAFCDGGEVTLVADTNGEYTYQWLYNGNVITGAVTSEFDVDFTGEFSLAIDSGVCSDTSDIASITVHDLPTVTQANFGTVCDADDPFVIPGGSPAGGIYTGNGVIYDTIFDPGSGVLGNNTLWYIYTDSNGCTDSVSKNLTVNLSPTMFTTSQTLCANASPFALNTSAFGFPTGGSHTGTGVSGTQFDPSLAGAGVHDVIYTSSAGCVSPDTLVVNVDTVPVVTLPSLGNVCIGGGSVALTTGTPTGGNYGGTAVSSNTFFPNVAGPGSHTIDYTFTDGNGCTASDTNEIFVDTIPSPDYFSLPNICQNAAPINLNDFVDPMGGVFSGSGVYNDTMFDPTAAGAGLHSITYILTTACDADTSSQSILVNASPALSISGTNISCNGGTDGTATVSGTGGSGFSYAWSTAGTSNTISSLSAGTYSVTVTNDSGCIDSTQITLSEPTELGIDSTVTSISCFSLTDGSVSVNGTGGTAPYSFVWSTSATTSGISSLSAGQYTVTVTDNNGCDTSATFQIIEPAGMSIDTFSSSDVVCFGQNDGSASVSVSGGVQPYSYSWSSGETTSMISALPPATYVVTITDVNGCTIDSAAVINEPSLLVLSIDSTLEPSCDEYSDGAIYTSTTGGIGTYSYSWNTTSTTANLSSVDSGYYSVTVTDDNGCTDTAGILVSDPDSIYATFSITNVTCNGYGDGLVTATVFNAIGSSAYLWSNGENSLTIDSLSGGIYALTITDANGCEGISQATVIEPAVLSISSATITNNECNGDSLAEILITPTGGGGSPYSYLWSNGATGSAIDSLTEGTYSVTVTSVNGCSYDSTITVTDPTPISLSVDSVAILLCFGDANGYAALSGSGGNANYSWEWSDAGTTAIRTNLTAGTYGITMTDGLSGNCTVDTTLTITQPDEIQIALDSISHVLCYGDSAGVIHVSATGGVGSYSYSWNNGDSSAQVAQLPAGSYQLTLTDGNGCTMVFEEEITQPDSLDLFSSVVPTTCSNGSTGSISNQMNGGVSPYSYLWSDGTSGSFRGSLDTGSYAVMVTDANGCIYVRSYEIGYQNEAPNANLGADTGYCEGDSVLLAPNTFGTFSWSTGSTDSSIYVSTIGFYSITATGNGCQDIDTVYVDEYELPEVNLGNDTMMCIADLEVGLILNGPSGMALYTWSTGGTDSTETITTFGWYWLVVENGFGCLGSDSIAVMGDTCLGIQDLVTVDWHVFPNPTRDRVMISSDRVLTDISGVSVYNSAGQLLMQKAFKGASTVLQVSQLPAGVYHLAVSSKRGREVWRTRLVLQ